VFPELNGTKKCNSKKWEIKEFCRAKPAFKGVHYLTDRKYYLTFNFEAILPFAKSG
jgi:hypothetical protein